jgi:hypothetical protein
MSNPKKPVSEKQLAANRANASHSTGPRTPEGKARSAQNSRKHGFTASHFAVVRLEELEEVARLESGLLTSCLNEALDTSGQLFIGMSQDLVGHGDIEITKAQNRNYALADGFQRMTSNKRSNTWPLFLRYKVLTEREYRRAKEEFEGLKALRHELPNEIHMTGMLATPGNENGWRVSGASS